jgi:hypothetical protein
VVTFGLDTPTAPVVNVPNAVVVVAVEHETEVATVAVTLTVSALTLAISAAPPATTTSAAKIPNAMLFLFILSFLFFYITYDLYLYASFSFSFFLEQKSVGSTASRHTARYRSPFYLQTSGKRMPSVYSISEKNKQGKQLIAVDNSKSSPVTLPVDPARYLSKNKNIIF